MSPAHSGRPVDGQDRLCVDPATVLPWPALALKADILAEPAFLTVIVRIRFVANGDHRSTSPGRSAKWARCALGGSSQARSRDARPRSIDGIDESKDRWRRAEAAVDRQLVKLGGSRSSSASIADTRSASAVPRTQSTARSNSRGSVPWKRKIACLKSPTMKMVRWRFGLARAAEKFRGQRLDDVPLLAVGVLRFIDQDMIGPAIELVADPFAHARRGKEPPGPSDQVVEIGDARSSAWPRHRRLRTPALRATPAAISRREPGAVLHPQEARNRHGRGVRHDVRSPGRHYAGRT